MATHHFDSAVITHYRSFKCLRVEKFSRVNVIGGLNGVGKTSLVDALFHFADRLNPGALLRPFQWNQILLTPMDNGEAIKQSYHNKNVSEPITISVRMGRAEYLLRYEYGPQDISPTAPTHLNQGEIISPTSQVAYSSDGEGFRVLSERNGKVEFDAKIQITSAGFIINIVNNSNVLTTPAVILNSSTRLTDASITQRFTSIIKEDRLSDIEAFLYLVHPEVKGLQLLTVSGRAIIHANIGDSNWVPLPFLGEGAMALTSAIVAIAGTPGGIVFLDELDAAVHHTVLERMWSLILDASAKFNTQIFVTTHSSESLLALTKVSSNHREKGLVSYIRIRKDKSGETSSVIYDSIELEAAMLQDWELR